MDGQGHGAHPHRAWQVRLRVLDPADSRACEVKSIEVVKTVGEIAGAPGASDNLLIVGDSGDALRSLGTIPEWAAKYRGKVKLVYIDPPFNTGQVFEHYADQVEHSIWLTMVPSSPETSR